MRWLLDTNIPLRALHPGQPEHGRARAAGRTLLERQDDLCFTLQGLTEFWNVCTRPATARGGLGLTVAQTQRRMRMLQRIVTFLADTDEVRIQWQRLVGAHQVHGVQVYDARLVASMLAHGVTHLLTFNSADFQRFPGIVVVHPQDVLNGRV